MLLSVFDVNTQQVRRCPASFYGLVEAMRFLGMENTSRCYQASTSELYGLVQEVLAGDNAILSQVAIRCSQTVYYWIAVFTANPRIYACNGILFNHESPRRGETFVTRKDRVVYSICTGFEDCLYMGNLDALRDWGHAKDYVRMQWHIMLPTRRTRDFSLRWAFNIQ